MTRVDVFMVAEFEPSLAKYTRRQNGLAGRAQGGKAFAP